jgi:hypothetical protein
MMARALTQDQLDVLRRYLEFETSLQEVRLKLRGIVEFELASEDGIRQTGCNFPPPEPDAKVARRRLEAALQRQRGQRISEQELMEWATRLFFDHPYDWDVEDAETNADWLNNISLELMGRDS